MIGRNHMIASYDGGAIVLAAVHQIYCITFKYMIFNCLLDISRRHTVSIRT